jgi:hypothetical protein
VSIFAVKVVSPAIASCTAPVSMPRVIDRISSFAAGISRTRVPFDSVCERTVGMTKRNGCVESGGIPWSVGEVVG